MARKTEAQLKAERQQLLKRYESRRSSIRSAELKEIKQGGILLQSFMPKATAKQIENINIKKLRSIVKELEPITARVVRTGIEYPTETGEKITATERFHRQASERAKRAAETRQGLPPELRRLRTAVTQTKDPRMKEALKQRYEQEKQEFLLEKEVQERQRKREEEQRDRLAASYIEAINNNDSERIEFLRKAYYEVFHQNIDDYPLVKDSLTQYPELEPDQIDYGNIDFNAPEETEETEEYEYEPEEDYDTVSEYEYTGDDYRTGDEYAEDDLSGYLSYLETVEELIKSGFYNTRGGLRRGKGRQGWTPYNFDEDKNTLLEMWRDTVDKYSNTPEDRRSLIEHIMANSGRLAELMTAIEYDSNQATYNLHYTEVYNILHFDAPTVEDLMNYGDIEEA